MFLAVTRHPYSSSVQFDGRPVNDAPNILPRDALRTAVQPPLALTNQTCHIVVESVAADIHWKN